VKLPVMIAAVLVSMAKLGSAQESLLDEPGSGPSFFQAPAAFVPETDADEESGDSFVLPRSLGVAAPLAGEESSFSIGPEGGYLRARGAERGTWFGGAKARLHFLRMLAAEASITFHEDRYNNSSVLVSQYPVQLTAFLYIIPEGPIRPYILGGVGWYYTRIDYRNLYSTIPDKTEHVFGEHLGAGAELMLGPRTSIDADVRYIFLNPSNNQVIHRDFNYWQIAFGLNFYF
jgi:outer membrane protein W